MIHPLTRHYSAIRSLPGVVDVQPSKTFAGEGLEIRAKDSLTAAHLDDILADSIKGRAVSFSFPGSKSALSRKDFFPAEEILKDYGSLLKSLPGVSYIDTVSIQLGEMLPAFETAVQVVAEDKAQATFLSEILEPEIAGTKVLVNSRQQALKSGY